MGHDITAYQLHPVKEIAYHRIGESFRTEQQDFYDALESSECNRLQSGSGLIKTFNYGFIMMASESIKDPHNKLFFIELIGIMRDRGLDEVSIEFG